MPHNINIYTHEVHVAECECGWEANPENSYSEAQVLGKEHLITQTERPSWITQAQWAKLIERGEILEADTYLHRPRRLVINLD